MSDFNKALGQWASDAFGIDAEELKLSDLLNAKKSNDYIKANGLDKFDNQGNPVLETLYNSAIAHRDEDHLNQYLDSWQSIVGAHDQQKQDQLEYYSNYVDSLKQAGLNPIMATTGGSLPTVSSANASMSNINAYEFLTREQNKMNIQYLKSITDIVKRLIPDHRKTNNASKIDANTILKIVK